MYTIYFIKMKKFAFNQTDMAIYYGTAQYALVLMIRGINGFLDNAYCLVFFFFFYPASRFK